MLQRLQQTFGVDANAHRCCRSYLVGRTQYVRRGAIQSLITRLPCGVSHGFVLVPLPLIVYTFDLIQLIEGYGLASHLHADETQVSGPCRPSNVSVFSSSISDCLRDVASRMKSNRLQLNSSKTELMWCATSRCRRIISYLRRHCQSTASWLTR